MSEDERLTALERRVDAIAEELREVKRRIDDLSENQTVISETVDRIKGSIREPINKMLALFDAFNKMLKITTGE